MNIQEYFNNFFKENLTFLEKEIIKLAKASKTPFLNELKAQFLETIVTIKSPLRVLEIGTGSGYSTYKILKALPNDAKLISIDYNFHRIDYFYENIFKKLPENLKDKLNIFPVESFYAIKIFQKIGETFDFIFIDAIKREYIQYFIEVDKILNKDGILLFDNISYNMQIINVEAKRSKNYLKGISLVNEFNKQLVLNKNYKTSLISIGDGMSLSVKIK